MRKLNLKMWASALAMVFVLGLQSCGGDKKGSNDQATDTAANKEANTKHSHDGHGDHSHKTEETNSEAIPEAAKTHVAGLLTQYLALKNALVAGDAEKAKTSASATLASLEKFDAASLTGKVKKVYDGQLDMIKTHNTKISKAANVEDQRKELDMLSMHVMALVKTFKANSMPLYKQHCPMAFDNKGAGWLSEQKEIRNPYFGEKMMKCGSVKDSLVAN